jgi:hypothetical protein
MKHSLFISLALVISLAFFSSCKKSDSPGTSTGNFSATVSFTIDGDNFHQQKISIQGAAKTITQCNYSSKDRETMITINDQSNINTEKKNEFFLVFNGNTPATQHAGDDTNGGSFSSVYFQVSVTDKNGTLRSFLFENADNTPGIFTVTNYGKVGEAVDGSFSGVLVDEDGDPNIKISGGSFSITRSQDID